MTTSAEPSQALNWKLCGASYVCHSDFRLWCAFPLPDSWVFLAGEFVARDGQPAQRFEAITPFVTQENP